MIRFLLLANFMATGLLADPKKGCQFPADPINWIVAYCSYVEATDDEITIQKGSCFQTAKADLSSKDECAINKKYKVKICERLVSSDKKKYQSVKNCLNSKEVEPFFAGG